MSRLNIHVNQVLWMRRRSTVRVKLRSPQFLTATEIRASNCDVSPSHWVGAWEMGMYCLFISYRVINRVFQWQRPEEPTTIHKPNPMWYVRPKKNGPVIKLFGSERLFCLVDLEDRVSIVCSKPTCDVPLFMNENSSAHLWLPGFMYKATCTLQVWFFFTPNLSVLHVYMQMCTAALRKKLFAFHTCVCKVNSTLMWCLSWRTNGNLQTKIELICCEKAEWKPMMSMSQMRPFWASSCGLSSEKSWPQKKNNAFTNKPQERKWKLVLQKLSKTTSLQKTSSARKWNSKTASQKYSARKAG